MLKTKDVLLKRVVPWILEHHWWVIGAAVLLLLAIEKVEHGSVQVNIYLLAKILFYVSTLMSIGILVESLVRITKAQSLTMKILETKRRLHLEVMRFDDWGELSLQLAKAPGEVAPIKESRLFIFNFSNGRLEPAVDWNENGSGSMDASLEEACWQCRMWQTNQELIFRLCQSKPVGSEQGPDQNESYCLPIKNNDDLLALIWFMLKPGKKLTSEQKTIFMSIGDDLALALKAGQDRKALSELRFTEASLHERRKVTHFLHDDLGQNIAFLRFKLAQVLEEKDGIGSEKLQNDLMHMLDVANDSFGIVRGALETMVPQASPHLANILQEYARKVCEQAHFNLSFKAIGKPLEMSPDTQREVFYIFREVLTNIEKYSKASRVEIVINWRKVDLEIAIQDDGIGFDSQSIDSAKHFGYHIVQDRISGLNGSFCLDSAENSGTRVEFSVPLAPYAMTAVRS
jgi:signal transduction histidine kinase